ncbi:hypothetical protein IHE51_00990 [Candidatus Parvarchaeota archaeon]|uniref:Uncharacterized protein n=1 Tax=Candidatus Acidifodinimicrobium mancum TaxID=2898728 RepID=A0A8T3V1W5_9ARCH|nr:hypothetical protein [Candidatus Acidifodinimicrobium mancum]MBE5730169.1 hypothetical protein [Candidatus Acidifodinimicrobium mancum]
MELLAKESPIIQKIIKETLSSVVGEERAESIFNTFMLDGGRLDELVHTMTTLLKNAGYINELNTFVEKLNDRFAENVKVSVFPEKVSLPRHLSEDVSVVIENNFDIPLVFTVILEDKDNFLDIIYEKRQEIYTNSAGQEAIIDSNEEGRFKFKLFNAKDYGMVLTTLFVIVRSREVEGLNIIKKIQIDVLAE